MLRLLPIPRCLSRRLFGVGAGAILSQIFRVMAATNSPEASVVLPFFFVTVQALLL